MGHILLPRSVLWTWITVLPTTAELLQKHTLFLILLKSILVKADNENFVKSSWTVPFSRKPHLKLFRNNGKQIKQTGRVLQLLCKVFCAKIYKHMKRKHCIFVLYWFTLSAFSKMHIFHYKIFSKIHFPYILKWLFANSMGLHKKNLNMRWLNIPSICQLNDSFGQQHWPKFNLAGCSW